MDIALPSSSPLSNGGADIASSGSMSTPALLSAAQVVQLARKEMQNAVEEEQNSAGGPHGMGNGLTPGITIDMSHRNIQTFPEEVVDIIKTELERLALSYNQISTLPARFAECTSLRYLNIRNNAIREFPLSVCQLSSLEILDISRNKLRTLPPELSKLTALKVLSIEKNHIEELPLCLGDIASLQCLKVHGNPIRFPPKEVLQPQADNSPNGMFKEIEIDSVTVTSQIKRYLKQRMRAERSAASSIGGEDANDIAESIPRPVRKSLSGRFPIKVHGSEGAPTATLPRPPPIPSRSHYRGLSQQNAAIRRPGMMPLAMGNGNERHRSNSENLSQRDRLMQQQPDRSRRMGIVSKKPSDLTTVAEAKLNRYSHLRGLSHGSAIQGGNSFTRHAASSADSLIGRSSCVKRLSSLPESKRRSSPPDPVMEAAKGILFALDQVQPLIRSMMGLTRDTSNKGTSLERVFFNATTHFERLDHDIQEYDTYSEEDEEVAPRSNAGVQGACVTCVSAYIHVCTLLSRHAESLLSNGDPRYIRMLLLRIYGSLVEIRNASVCLLGPKRKAAGELSSVSEAASAATREDTIRPTSREKSAPHGLPNPSLRLRAATATHQPSDLRVVTDTKGNYFNGSGRSATMASSTPRSGESFMSLSSGGRAEGEISEEERLFEAIFLGLQQSSEMAMRTLPTVNAHFMQSLRQSMQQGAHEQLKHYFQTLGQRCTSAQQSAEALRARLSAVKLTEPGVRTQSSFWELCRAFMGAYYNLVVEVKEVKSMTPLLSTEVIALLRPLQKAIRDASQLIQASPWSYMAGSGSGSGSGASAQTHAHMQTPASQVALTMTPATAALGPAVQATVPNASAGPGGNTVMFHGNVFERADAQLGMRKTGNGSFSARAGHDGGEGSLGAGGSGRYGGKVVF